MTKLVLKHGDHGGHGDIVLLPLTLEQKQKLLPIVHDEPHIDAGYRMDLLIEDSIILELKACKKFCPYTRLKF